MQHNLCTNDTATNPIYLRVAFISMSKYASEVHVFASFAVVEYCFSPYTKCFQKSQSTWLVCAGVAAWR